MKRIVTLFLLVFLLNSCFLTGSDPVNFTPIPDDCALSKIKVGLNEMQVRDFLGAPDDASTYEGYRSYNGSLSSKSEMLTEWVYQGLGKVFFALDEVSKKLKVAQVVYDPVEEE